MRRKLSPSESMIVEIPTAPTNLTEIKVLVFPVVIGKPLGNQLAGDQ